MEKYRSLPARGAKSGGILLLSSVVALMCLAMVGLGFYQYESSAMLVDSFDRDFIPAAIVLWTAVVAWAAPRLGTEAGEIGLEARLP
jgi:hypothetical protein